MITKQALDVLASIARLTEAEQKHLIATLQGLPIATIEPLRVTVFETSQAIPEPARRASKKFTHWSEEDTLILMQFDEDSQRMSDSEIRREYRRLVRLFGRSPSAVKNKLWKIRHGEQ